jgi:dTDP-4-dehydrorhamnose reductase
MSRVLVLGAAGMLGHKVCAELARRGHAVAGSVRRPPPRLASLLPGVELRTGVDVLQEGGVERLIAELRPEALINAVGVVKQHAQARETLAGVNAALPHRLARACRPIGARLIHMSTDCVFSGRRGGYAESDPCDAEDAYGWSKYLGEPEGPGVLTIRSSLIGRELQRPTHGLVEWFLAQRGKTVKGFARAVFSGFTNLEMARIMADVVEKRPGLSGLHHVAAAPIDKFDLLSRVKAAAKADVEILRDESFVCDRSLKMEGFAKATGYAPPGWDAMIREMCADPTPYDDIQSEAR